MTQDFDADISKISLLGERLVENEFFSVGDYLNYLKHVFAYERAAQVCAGRKTLDLGCGSGYGTILLAQTSRGVTGVDLSPGLIALLSKRFVKENVSFQVYDGQRLPFQDAEFECVVSLQVMEHVKDVQNYLNEIRRVLKPGGIFVMTTPNRKIRLLPFQRPWNPHHVREYSFGELNGVLGAFFADVKGYSLLAGEEFTRLDLERVCQQPWKVYLEYPVKNIVGKVLPFLRRGNFEKPAPIALSAAERERFSAAELRYVPKDLPRALDLYFECVKT